MNYFYVCLSLYLTILIFKVVLTIIKPKKLTIASTFDIDYKKITIVQPILSGDPTLEETLSFNLHANPDVNFLWLIDDNDNKAQELVKLLKQDFSHINIKVLSYKDCPDKINPKVFKLNQGLKSVLTDYVVILDDDAMILPETLCDLVINLKENDLTTALPIYKDNGNFWCKLMTQFVNNNSAMTYLPLLWFWKPMSINGMCYALKTTTIRQLNYFDSILGFLADDLSLALIMKEKKMNLYQSRHSVLLQTNIETYDRYKNLMHRWFLFATLLLKNHSVKENIVITVLHGIAPLFLWMTVLYGLRDGHYILLPLVLVIRLLLIQCVHRQVFGKKDLYYYGFSLLAELLQPVHLFHAFVRKTIFWRTHIYRVESNEKFYEVESS